MSADILTRLQQATGPNRDLDAEIWLATTEGATRKATEVKSSTDKWPPYVIDETRDATGRLITVPAYTASIDASLALAESKMPGCEIELTNLYNIARCTLHQDVGSFYGTSEVNSLPLAILSALFSALTALQETDNDHG